VNAGHILYRMERLRRAAHTQHPALDKRGGCAGIALQQLLNGRFRINLYHDRMIASTTSGIFALAQRCKNKKSTAEAFNGNR
jgi:hypothetical protein